MSELREVGAAVDRLTREVDLLRALLLHLIDRHEEAAAWGSDLLAEQTARSSQTAGEHGHYTAELQAALDRAEATR